MAEAESQIVTLTGQLAIELTTKIIDNDQRVVSVIQSEHSRSLVKSVAETVIKSGQSS